MDGIAAISARIAAIQQTIATVSAARPTAGVTPVSPDRPGTAGASSFAAVLERETVAGTARPGAGGAVADALPAVSGLTAEQVRNAAAVVRAGQGMGLSLRDQVIGVMTALGESSLRVLDHGDRAGPDSRGLFQQRDNGAWGTLAQRMDPTASAQSFFRALSGVEGRDAMAPTLVAHRVQRNADPQHYTRWWDQAVDVVSRLTGAPATQIRA
ncbi:hypothetical protein [Actinotalea ferrariae]|uniref:hypothetical protein n=1 Tax=Actinotalea ferrariae TaxID=1386098 RepID=UPI00068E396A|nr:hypothetical protein [Actinotalea ferrariae]